MSRHVVAHSLFGMIAAAFSLLPVAVAAQTQIDSEVLALYAANEERFKALTAELTAKQWEFRPAEDAWSILEIAEHIVLNESWALGQLGDLSPIEVTDETLARAAATETQVVAVLGDRNQKFQAPDFLVPTGSYGDAEGVMRAFTETRSSLIAVLHSVDYEPRSRAAAHFALGSADMHTWAAIIVAHSDRHLDQIEEWMASPGFSESASSANRSPPPVRPAAMK